MATDYLVLGGFLFDDWSTPERIPFGGSHRLKIHKLPGGGRVIDTLGPDDDEIAWRGQFWGEDSPARVAAIEAMRISGQPVSLTFAGNAYEVIVDKFKPTVVRFPQHYLYEISCTPTANSGGGFSGGIFSFADLIASDMASALSVVGL